MTSTAASGDARAPALTRDQPARGAVLVAATAIGLIGVAVSFLGTIGADSRWLAALGRVIVHRHAVPSGVPFATAPSAHWPNVPVLAELAFHGLEAGLGDRGLVVAQLLAVAIAFAVVARDSLTGGARAGSTAAVMLAVAVACLPSLVIVRAQLFSIALFPIVVVLLRSERRRPSRRIWLVLPLLALWSNLHGAVLVGLAVVLAYLLFDRVRQDAVTAVAIALAAPVALCLTPALGRTVTYYHGVLTNVAAERGVGLWAPLSIRAPFDVVAVVVALVLIVRLRSVRVPLWEIVAIAGLAVSTVHTARSAVWLLLFLVGPAARSFTLRVRPGRFAVAIPSVLLVVVCIGVARGPASVGASDGQVDRAIALAHGGPILADGAAAEQIALAGGRVWISNPLDAFSHHDQARYLDWLAGASAGRAELEEPVQVVLVQRDSKARRIVEGDGRFRLVASDRTASVFVRQGTGP